MGPELRARARRLKADADSAAEIMLRAASDEEATRAALARARNVLEPFAKVSKQFATEARRPEDRVNATLTVADLQMARLAYEALAPGVVIRLGGAEGWFSNESVKSARARPRPRWPIRIGRRLVRYWCAYRAAVLSKEPLSQDDTIW